MKSVVVYSVGSCDANMRMGFYEAAIEFKTTRRYVRANLADTTANRCIIEGMLACVRLLKEPCDVKLVSATAIGIGKAARGKGVNYDLIADLFAELDARKCSYTFEVREGKGEELRRLVRAMSRKNPGIYDDWGACESQIKGYSFARYKSFRTLPEAEIYLLG